MAKAKLSEQRARYVTRELLEMRGWDIRPVSAGGQLLEEAEYRSYPPLVSIFDSKSKTGKGFGKPDFLLVESSGRLIPRVVIDTKTTQADLPRSIADTAHYGEACYDAGFPVLSVAVAGAVQEVCGVRAQRMVKQDWKFLTLHREPINWIPSPELTTSILAEKARIEVDPERPSEQVLSAYANRLNKVLRECGVKDELRPNYAAAFMLAQWYDEVSTSPKTVLRQINEHSKAALESANKVGLADSLRVPVGNRKLADRAWEIIDILNKLSIRSFMQEHDYLGQLYETFFRYTGGNTIGQYFTPRHIIALMCEIVDVTPKDRVFDPACGTGGFLIGALNRMIRLKKLDYQAAIKLVKNNLYGIEAEPTTAALCVANMILRGDGTSGIVVDDCFTLTNYPRKPATIALLNPPFKTDIPETDFIDRALASVEHKGLLASVVPYSLLVKTKDWHKHLLKNNRLLFVATMPPDLFQPYAGYNTAVIVLQKGVPHRNGKVFFCRISNDGFKLKKKTRIKRLGSQLEDCLAAYDQKTEEPEFSAYRAVAQDTAEWSPEAYLASAPRTDADFLVGFEDFVRKHAAFYIANGQKLTVSGVRASKIELQFSNKSDLSLARVPIQGFVIADYFSVALGGKDEIEDLNDESESPIVSTSEFNNGITTWKSPEYLFHPPVITVATDGSVCSSFVQEFPFYAFYKVALLRPIHPNVPTDALYYIAYSIARERWRYVYARKFGKARISETILYLPASKSGEPAFDKMAELTRRCAAYPVISAFRENYRTGCARRFPNLAARWKKATRAHSSAARMAANPNYQEIVAMGSEAIPLILEELRKDAAHWFTALITITGVNPVSKEQAGVIKEMRNAWIAWGRQHGYVNKHRR